MHPILFKIGPLTIYTYGFFVFLGIVVAYWLSKREAVREGIEKDVFANFFFWCLIAAFLGARLLYIIVEWEAFRGHPFRMLWNRSGFVFYGGVIGGLTAFYFLAKKHHLDLLKLADIIALYIPLGHALGRLGCFSYGCCYGKVTNSWIGMRFPPQSPAGLLGEKVIPTQLISSFFLLIIFFLLSGIKRKKKFNGQIVISYLFLYGVFRFIIEFFRGDPRGSIFIFSTSQFISLIAVVIAILLWIKARRLE